VGSYRDSSKEHITTLLWHIAGTHMARDS